MPADWTFRAVLLVAMGAALGGILRYFAGVWLSREGYPGGTAAANLSGSFVVAVFMFWGVAKGVFGPDARSFFATGVLGGFTTMSSFAYETVSFVDDGEGFRAATYAALTFVGCLGMAFLGRAAAQLIP
jgi:CrcB protein